MIGGDDDADDFDCSADDGIGGWGGAIMEDLY